MKKKEMAEVLLSGVSRSSRLAIQVMIMGIQERQCRASKLNIVTLEAR